MLNVGGPLSIIFASSTAWPRPRLRKTLFSLATEKQDASPESERDVFAVTGVFFESKDYLPLEGWNNLFETHKVFERDYNLQPH